MDIQLTKIAAAIGKYANMTGSFHGRRPGGQETHCIMGGLSKDLGLNTEDVDSVTQSPTVSKAITTAYGLTQQQQCKMQDINDTYRDTRTRRKALLEQVTDWATRQQQAKVTQEQHLTLG